MISIADNTFAAACFDQNSIAELEAALAEGADETDCRTWGLTPEQWQNEINLALAAKREHSMQRLGGSTTTEAKAAAARENGRKGGRPRTPQDGGVR